MSRFAQMGCKLKAASDAVVLVHERLPGYNAAEEGGQFRLNNPAMATDGSCARPIHV